MEETKQDRALKLLQENPDGVSVTEVKKYFGYTATKGATNLMYLLKKKGYSIEKKNNIYKLLSKKKGSTSLSIKSPSQLDIILKALMENPTGVSGEGLASTSGSARSRIPNRVWHLRQRGYNIWFSNGIYRLEGEQHVAPVKKEPVQKFVQHVPAPKNTTYKLIPAEYRKAFLSLSDSDKSDCIDMIRKSVYYNKSAIALLESNKITLEFIEAIESGI